MKLVDANLLLYAIDEQAPHHDKAAKWVRDRLSGAETIGFAWVVLLAVIRIGTNPRLFANPFAPDAAIELVDGWLAQPCTTIVEPTGRHTALLGELLRPLGTAGNLTMDAHLAALAIEHGAELCSADADFGRFPGLRWSNPLA